jgi:hypothetical protein
VGTQPGDDRSERVGGAWGVGFGNVQHDDSTVVGVAEHMTDNGGRVIVECIMTHDVVLHDSAANGGDRP